MSTSTAELKRIAHPEYWDERYASVGPGEQVHEWFRSFDDLKPFLDRHLFQVRAAQTAPRILHLGSGDSVSFFGLGITVAGHSTTPQTIPEDLTKMGYKNQICVDFSTVVV